jgi:hypothetical protein
VSLTGFAAGQPVAFLICLSHEAADDTETVCGHHHFGEDHDRNTPVQGSVTLPWRIAVIHTDLSDDRRTTGIPLAVKADKLPDIEVEVRSKRLPIAMNHRREAAPELALR